MGYLLATLAWTRDLWTATPPLGQLAAVVAIVTAAIQFSTAFVNRRSSRLVARDQSRRDYLRQVLTPAIEDMERMIRDFDQLWSDLHVHQTKPPGRVAMLQAWSLKFDAYANDIGLVTMIGERFPLIRQTGQPTLALLIEFYKTVLANPDPNSAVQWIRNHDEEYRRYFLAYHRAVEHILFGTDWFWAFRMKCRRGWTSLLRVVDQEKHQ